MLGADPEPMVDIVLDSSVGNWFVSKFAISSVLRGGLRALPAVGFAVSFWQNTHEDQSLVRTAMEAALETAITSGLSFGLGGLGSLVEPGGGTLVGGVAGAAIGGTWGPRWAEAFLDAIEEFLS